MKTLLRAAVVMAGLLFAALPPVAHAESFAYSSQGSGSFAVTPVSPSVLQEDQTLTFDYFLPFPLQTGVFQGFVDLTIANFPERLIASSFTLYGAGGDTLFGTYTVDTSVFSDPVNPLLGDFTGSEDFTGHFTFTGGTGFYAGATGGGTYVGHSDYLANNPYALFSGESTLTAIGTVTPVPEPSTGVLTLAGLAALFASQRRRARKT